MKNYRALRDVELRKITPLSAFLGANGSGKLTLFDVLVLYRDEQGFTVCKRTAEMQGIKAFLETGAQLGQLWMEGYFEFGDPLTNASGPKGIETERNRVLKKKLGFCRN